jgi:hypothetical protein
MNPPDLRAELLKKAKENVMIYDENWSDDTYESITDFALPYAEQVAELQTKLDEAKPAMTTALFGTMLDWVEPEQKKNEFIEIYNSQIETEHTIKKLRQLKIESLQQQLAASQQRVKELEIAKECVCPAEIKTGWIQWNCCNICGRPEPVNNK